MTRTLATIALLLGCPTAVFAQPLAPGIGVSPPPGIAAGVRLPYPAAPHPAPSAPRYPCAGGFGGGFCPPIPISGPGFPFSGVWGGGYGFGGVYPGYGYGYAPFGFNSSAPVYESQPPEIRTAPNVALVNEFPAVLTLEFPVPAEVWVGGKKGEGKPTTEWTLTSPSLKAGVEFTFEVKARWTVEGKTFEYERSVKVASGNRSRALVVAGTEIKE